MFMNIFPKTHKNISRYQPNGYWCPLGQRFFITPTKGTIFYDVYKYINPKKVTIFFGVYKYITNNPPKTVKLGELP